MENEYLKLAKAIAKREGWIVWIETEETVPEGEYRPEYVFKASFKRKVKPDAKCPHCGGDIWTSHYQIVYVSEPRNIYAVSPDPDEAWRLLVDDYLAAKNISMDELKIRLAVEGLV